MAINIVTVEDLQQFKIDLLGELTSIISNSIPIKKQWLKSPDVREILGISPGTLQTLRINRTLPYSKVGGTIYYEYADIMKVLEQNKNQK
jgi:Helix-turn-helix domain